MMNPIAQNPTPGAAGAETNVGTAEKVRAVFNGLAKLVLGKKIYAKNNPTLLRFSDDFMASLRDFFEEESVLVVSIDKYQIRWNDQTVYENDKREESIAFILYKDGIGELSIPEAVTWDEIEQFIDLVKEAVRSVSQDEDIVTQLWKADFEHISYRILDEYLVGEFGDGRRREGQSNLELLETDDHPDAPGFSDKGRVIVSGPEEIEPLDRYLNRLVGRDALEMSEEEREQHFQDMMSSFFTVSSDELRVFKEKLFEKKRKDNLVSFITEYLDFAVMEGNSAAVRDVMIVVERLVDYLVSELRASVLAAQLNDLRQFMTTEGLPEDVKVFAEKLENKLTDPSILLSLAETAGSSDEEAEEGFAYFEAVGEKAIPTMIKLIEENSDPKLHKRARETLVRIAGDGLADAIARLNIDKPQVARDVILLSKAARFREIPKVIKELVYYPDDHVRHEAIRFLAGFGTDDALSLLVKLLDDADKGVRLKTLSVVSEVDASIVREKIVETAFSREFAQKEFDEQVEIFKAMGKAVGRAVLPKLRQRVGKKAFLGLRKRRTKEQRLLAVEALAQINDPGARKLLDDLAKDSDDAVKSRAIDVLRRAGGGQGTKQAGTSQTQDAPLEPERECETQ